MPKSIFFLDITNFVCEFLKKNGSREVRKMTQTTLFEQNKSIFQKLDAIINPELVLKLSKVLIIMCLVRFHFKVAV